jgi:hypothetical protein
MIASIRDKLLAELNAQKWADVSPANVIVKDGVGIYGLLTIPNRKSER